MSIDTICVPGVVVDGVLMANSYEAVVGSGVVRVSFANEVVFAPAASDTAADVSAQVLKLPA